jgi:formylglycine-generating enzyme required for sulfatase activity
MKYTRVILIVTIMVLASMSADAQAQMRNRLAILPFTGTEREDGQTIAMLLANLLEKQMSFTVVPRTSNIDDAIMTEQRFQRSGITDSDTISEFGKQLNADFVVSGHIQKFQNHNLVFINIINVETFQQIAGVYREYSEIEEVRGMLPDMVAKLVNATKIDTSRMPGLAVLPFDISLTEINAQDAEILAQLLATEIANSGLYAVLPRTKVIETAMTAEQSIQRSGMTDVASIKAIGMATNAQYVLSGNVRSLGRNINLFLAQILSIEQASLFTGDDVQYTTIDDGLRLMTELSAKLTTKRPEMTYFLNNFVEIKGGTFTMGSSGGEINRNANEIVHRVTIDNFYMGKREVTQGEYEEVMGINPSGFKDPSLPVEQVNWYSAVEYCNKLSEREGLTSAYIINKGRLDTNNTNNMDTVAYLVLWNRNANGYRLPTEAEWEYACRAGTTTPFSTGSNITAEQANYNGDYPYNNNATGVYRQRTMPSGSFAANNWGLYDMHGNVWEWCWDWYADYDTQVENNPSGLMFGAQRVIRGGGWYGFAQNLRSSARIGFTPSTRASYLGFRVVRSGI